MSNPKSSLLAGLLTAEQLQEALTKAQLAYLDLGAGEKGVSFSYSQGDGTRSVSYQQTDMTWLKSQIQLLQAQLGIVPRPRRALGIRYHR